MSLLTKGNVGSFYLEMQSFFGVCGYSGRVIGYASYQLHVGWQLLVNHDQSESAVSCSLTYQAGLTIAERVVYVTSGIFAERLEVVADETQFYPLAIACYATSLEVNAISTALIGYQAW